MTKIILNNAKVLIANAGLKQERETVVATTTTTTTTVAGGIPLTDTFTKNIGGTLEGRAPNPITGNPHQIPTSWRSSNTAVTELQIGNTCTSIGSYAFNYCSNLTGSLTIPNSVTSIETFAFWGCSGFDGTLTIGNSVTSIGNYAFYNCSGFTGSLTIGNSVTTIGNYAFYNCPAFDGSLTIPNSVTSIGIFAFYNSGFIGSLTIPNSVTTIGSNAFYGCTNITNVDCYVTKTIFDQTNVLLNSGVTTIHVCSDDVTWTAGAGQFIGGKSGITVIKDLVCGTTTTTTT